MKEALMKRKSNTPVFMGITWLLALFLAGSALAIEDQAKKAPKIFISADMEGIADNVNAGQLSSGQFDYERGRKYMTAEVNAAIEGCLAAGAGEIVVADSHGNAQNIIPEDLNEKAILIRSFPRPLLMMEGIDQTFDGVIFIGYHPKEGTPGANLAHTIWGSKFLEIKINGKAVSEAAFNAAVAGHFNVPVILVAGDQNITRETMDAFGPIETVITKKSLGWLSAAARHPHVVCAEIREKAEKAVRRIREIKPFIVQTPVRMDISFKNLYDAEAVAYLPWVKRIGGNTVSVEVPTILEADRFITALNSINSR
jgi:D-amino peptidase